MAPAPVKALPQGEGIQRTETLRCHSPSLGCCPMFESFAQNCEDVVLWRALRHVAAGTYVDVGAADPEKDSVTKAFYDRGWSGLNVEPAAEYADALRKSRPRDVTLQMCAGETTGTVTFHHVPGTGLSSVLGSATEALDDEFTVVEENVEVRRLDEMLAEHGFVGRDIHFLKVDVEGFEESVLRGIDLRQWRPWVVVVEATAPRSTEQMYASWEPILFEAGYRFCLFDGLNRFYLADERGDLGSLLAAPACVFDQPFTTQPHAALLREYDNAMAGYRRLEDQYHRALSDFDDLQGIHQQGVSDFQRIEGMYLQAVADYQRMEQAYLQAVADYQRLEQTYLSTVDDYRGVESAYLSSLDELDRLRQRIGQQLDEIEQSRSEASSLGSEVRLLVDQRDVLRGGVAEMGAEYDSLRSERDRWRHEVELMQQTLSWRITRPLRAVRRRVR